jgi:hypothetical protein
MDQAIAERKYKTGDLHPELNQTAFVEYDENGHEIWTSIYGDTEAPYRLANLNAQGRSAGMKTCSRIPCTETRTHHQQSSEASKEHSDAQPHKSVER